MKFRAIVVLLAVLAAGCQSLLEERRQREAAIARFKAGQALFEEKCKAVAGEKIYRTVEGVEGILLLKVRPNRGEAEWRDPMWPGAAFAQEFAANAYVESFLLYEQRPASGRGHVDSGVSEFPGYRWVEASDDTSGIRYRYTGRLEEPWQHDKSYLKGYKRFVLERSPANNALPRYGVTFEDHVVPEERNLGVASSTVNVIDLQKNEVLAELTRYVWSPAAASANNPSPWLVANKCGGEEAYSTTRFFVDKVLKPIRGK